MSEAVMKMVREETSFRIKFAMTGTPMAKGRPRSRIVTPKDRRKEPFVHIYADPKSAANEKAIKQAAAIAMGFRDAFTGPIMMRVTAVVPIPASWPKGRKTLARNGLVYPETKPDIDNYLKLVMDSCNGIVYVDDKQVVEITGSKRYGIEPRLEIEVEQFA